jgi:hypothetical protein
MEENFDATPCPVKAGRLSHSGKMAFSLFCQEHASPNIILIRLKITSGIGKFIGVVWVIDL